MTKKDYMKPAMRTVQLQHKHQILEGSYAGIQTKTGDDNDNDNDNDVPIYDDSSNSYNLWDAN